MADQFERVHNLAEHRGHVVVLLYGDRHSSAASKTLGEWLHLAFHPTAHGQPPARGPRAPGTPGPDVRTVTVACVGPVPALLRKLICSQVRAASPAVPVWLDFTDQMKQLYGLQPRVPNVIVIDPTGRFRLSATGDLDAKKRQALADAIEGLRREAAGARR
jgi:hypothetical protein